MLSNVKKWGQRFSATRFEFQVHVHSLQPWPASHKAIAVGWQRGKKRRGATSSVFPLPAPGKEGTVVRFNERFTVNATMYKVGLAGAWAPRHCPGVASQYHVHAMAGGSAAAARARQHSI